MTRVGPDVRWWLAAAFVVAVLLGTFHEGLLGLASIEGAASLPWQDPIYQDRIAAPMPFTFDPSPGFLYQPWDDACARAFRAGALPLWQAACGFGSPLLANGQVAPFNPLKLLLLGGAVGPAQAWFLVSRLLVAALGMLLLARRLGLSPMAGALAALAFAANGFFAWHFQFSDVHGPVFLPWALLAVDRLMQDPGPRWAGATGLAIGLMGLAGHPETALFGAVGLTAVVAWRVAREPDRRRERVGAFAGAVALSIAVAAVGVFPFLEVVRASTSYHLSRTGSAFEEALAAITPAWVWGDVARHLVTPRGRDVNNYNAWIGTLAICLVPAGLAVAAVRRVALPIAAVMGLFLLVLPPGNLLPAPPVSANGFYTPPILAFALALLAGAGLDRLLTGDRRVALGVAALGLLAAPIAYRLERGDALIHQLPAIDPTTCLAALATAGLGVAAWRAPGRTAWVGAAAVAVMAAQAADTLRRAAPPLPRVDYPRPGVVAAIHAAGGDARVAGGGVLAPMTHLMHGVDTPEFIDAFQPRRYITYWEAMHPQPEKRGNMYVLRPDARPALLDLAGVGWLLTPEGGAATRLAPLIAAQPARYERVGAWEGVALHRNRAVLPRAWVAYDAAWVPADRDGLAAAAALVALGDGVRRRLVLETPDGRPPAGWAPDPAASPTAASVVRRGPGEVLVAAELPRPGVLLLTDAWYPGWTATVDGVPAPILAADVAFRGVMLPAGRHEVAFVYAPAIVIWSLGLSGLGLLGCGLLIARGGRRRRPENAA